MYFSVHFSDLIVNRFDSDVYQNPELSSLVGKVSEVVLQSKAKNTGKTYQSAFNSWCRWADRCGLNSMPASDFDFSLYLVHLIQSCKSPSSIDEAFYGVKWAHELAGHTTNPSVSFLTKSIREAAHRILGHSVCKKEPITADMLRSLVNLYGRPDSDLMCVRNITMCLIAFAGFLRFSEMSNIRRSDIIIHSSHASIHIVKSKTDIYRNGADCIIARTDSDTCPVTMLEKYLNMANMNDSSDAFIFRSVSLCKKSKVYKLRGDNHLSYTRCREIVLDMLSSIGLDKSKFGLHSLRSGGATAAANKGIADRLFKRHGRWRSESAKDGYVKDDVDKLMQVSKNLGI